MGIQLGISIGGSSPVNRTITVTVPSGDLNPFTAQADPPEGSAWIANPDLILTIVTKVGSYGTDQTVAWAIDAGGAITEDVPWTVQDLADDAG